MRNIKSFWILIQCEKVRLFNIVVLHILISYKNGKEGPTWIDVMKHWRKAYP